MAPVIVLFDGVCNLCNASVNFIIDRDPAGHFLFAPLQGATAPALLQKHGRSIACLDTVLLIEGGQVFTRSSAALRILRQLNMPWPLLAVFLLVPAGIRDRVYGFIARNRYRWFGRTAACRVPTPELRARFLD